MGIVQRQRAAECDSKTLVCCRRGSGVYIVSMQQTQCSAISRDFEPCFAPDSMCAGQDCRVIRSEASSEPVNDMERHIIERF